MGIAFVLSTIFAAIVVSRAFEIGRGSLPLPDPRSDSAFLYLLCLIALVALSYMIGKGVARLLRRSQVRFFAATGAISHVELLLPPSAKALRGSESVPVQMLPGAADRR